MKVTMIEGDFVGGATVTMRVAGAELAFFQRLFGHQLVAVDSKTGQDRIDNGRIGDVEGSLSIGQGGCQVNGDEWAVLMPAAPFNRGDLPYVDEHAGRDADEGF
jgi:hypothetical protein